MFNWRIHASLRLNELKTKNRVKLTQAAFIWLRITVYYRVSLLFENGLDGKAWLSYHPRAQRFMHPYELRQ